MLLFNRYIEEVRLFSFAFCLIKLIVKSFSYVADRKETKVVKKIEIRNSKFIRKLCCGKNNLFVLSWNFLPKIIVINTCFRSVIWLAPDITYSNHFNSLMIKGYLKTVHYLIRMMVVQSYLRYLRFFWSSTNRSVKYATFKQIWPKFILKFLVYFLLYAIVKYRPDQKCFEDILNIYIFWNASIRSFNFSVSFFQQNHPHLSIIDFTKNWFTWWLKDWYKVIYNHLSGNSVHIYNHFIYTLLISNKIISKYILNSFWIISYAQNCGYELSITRNVTLDPIYIDLVINYHNAVRL